MTLHEARGSARLIDAYRNRGVELDEALVSRLSDSLADLDIHDVLVKGIPNPEILRAGFSVTGQQETGIAIQRILEGLKGVPQAEIRLFPRGIPWPEVFNIEVTVGQP